MTDAPPKPAAAVDFYFDFSSPYGYFAAETITPWLPATGARCIGTHPHV